MVRLKGVICGDATLAEVDFNSGMVRLKVSGGRGSQMTESNFNSGMVRLKGGLNCWRRS